MLHYSTLWKTVQQVCCPGIMTSAVLLKKSLLLSSNVQSTPVNIYILLPCSSHEISKHYLQLGIRTYKRTSYLALRVVRIWPRVRILALTCVGSPLHWLRRHSFVRWRGCCGHCLSPDQTENSLHQYQCQLLQPPKLDQPLQVWRSGALK